MGGCATRPGECPVESLATAAIQAERSQDELSGAHPRCPQEDLAAAYRQALDVRCEPARGWREGLESEDPNSLCPQAGGRIWNEANGLGRRYREFSAELEETEAKIADLRGSDQAADQAAARRANFDRVRLIRELDAIRGVARIRGWMQ